MDKYLLKGIAFFNPMLERAGVNTAQLHEILRIKMLIDNRRPNMMFTGRRNNNKPISRNSIGSIIGTVFMGGMMAIFLLILRMPLAGQTLYFGMFMVMMGLTLISDFTTILIDTRDQFIIMPRPVNDRTVTLSRILHITIYVLKLALLQGIAGIIAVCFIDGVAAAPVFLLQIIETTLLSILFVNIIYLIMMRSLSPQRIKDVISYFQIGFSIFIFGIYYLLPRLIDKSAIQHIDLTANWYNYLLPPVWIASLNEVIFHASRANLLMVVSALVGLVLPFVGIWIVATVLAPGFNRKLTAIATGGDSPATSKKAASKKSPALISRLANFLAPDPVENAGFRITAILAARSREFKMKVFPAFAYLPVYLIAYVMSSKSGAAHALGQIQKGGYIFAIYLSSLLLATILQYISMSEKYKASWVYYALPVDQPGKIQSGMLKAIISLYFFPYCLVLSIVIIAFCGPTAIINVALAFMICVIYGLLMALFMVKGLPFSKPVLNKQRGGRIIVSLLVMGLIAILGVGHLFLLKYNLNMVIYGAAAVCVGIIWLMFRYYKKQGWDSVDVEEM